MIGVTRFHQVFAAAHFMSHFTARGTDAEPTISEQPTLSNEDTRVIMRGYFAPAIEWPVITLMPDPPRHFPPKTTRPPFTNSRKHTRPVRIRSGCFHRK